ncbi:integrase [Clostridioides difficile]|nr:integrase [Clostridioides difficile]EGT4016889.1 integrase [Clostridioides difficile]EGT4184954.1 integrase [Clostridioides difficile]EGT4216000.1 integrase [Clostridioides difficile]EGT5474181.1 integrase [Clostridioides difficile]
MIFDILIITTLEEYTLYFKNPDTMLLENGTNIKDIQHILGHAKTSTTMDTYLHVTNNMRNQTVNIFKIIVE